MSYLKMFIAIGPHSWGKANTINGAVRKAVQNAPAVPLANITYAIYECDPRSVLNGAGQIVFPVDGKRPRHVRDVQKGGV